MEKNNLRVKFSHGDITVELEGESSTVLTELRSLKKDGTGRIVEFFGMTSVQPTTVVQPSQTGKTTTPVALPHVDVKGFPPLKDIVLKDLPKSEPEWICIYGYFASNGGKKIFTREELWGQCKTSERANENRNANLSNNIKQAVMKGWLSNVSEDTFSLLANGVTKAKEITSREKPAKKRVVKSRTKKTTKEAKS